MAKELGLVLAGGGGKGAYQIGVWKYLHEVGLDQKITAVSGTSVGALNSALFAMGDLDVAVKLWENISPSQILSPKTLLSLLSEAALPSLRLLKSTLSQPLPLQVLEYYKATLFPQSNSRHDDFQKANVNILLHLCESSSCFSRTGLAHIIQKLDLSKILLNAMPCYATCLCIKTTTPTYFDLSQYTTEQIKTLLLASSAIPYIFAPVKFNGLEYYDGGLPKFGDNIPIKPLYDKGIRKIIVVHLKQNSSINYSLFPGAEILEISPSEDLGNFIDGTLDFTSDGAQKRIKLGEDNARSIFNGCIKEEK